MAKYRIMVVDDDPDVRFVVSSLLGLDFETVEARNGLDALEKIDRAQPDLLLMDISMPVMNGIACCLAIQRLPDLDPPAVIFLSTTGDAKTRQAAVAVGALDYIEKPFDTAALIESIRRHLHEKGIEPSEKALSIDEVRAVDARPMESLAAVPVSPSPERRATSEVELPSSPGGGPRTRRVFGRQRSTPQPASNDCVELPTPPAPDYKSVARRAKEETKPAPSDCVELPTPPAPDYHAVAKRQHSAHEAPPAPPPPQLRATSDSVPRFEPPKPPAEARTLPPAAKAPPGKNVLAERRLRALGLAPKDKNAKPRVLVILDDPNSIATWHEALRKIAEFLPLEDPVEAVELIARYQPDIVVTPVAMQGFSGLELAMLLRESTRLSHVELVFVQTGREGQSALEACERLSRNPMIGPPLTDVRCRMAVQPIFSKASFSVRDKALTYGQYVKEVIQHAERERAVANKEREKRALKDSYSSLRQFMARELKDYKEPEAAKNL